MKIFQVIFSAVIIVVQSGCGYPHHELYKLDELAFENKRLDNKARAVQEFIRPEETAGALTELTLRDFSSDKKENLVLNILDYTRGIRQKGERKEFWQYPAETIERGGDCEDKAFLLLSMLIQAGIKRAVGVKGRYLGGGHMWVEYNGYILDPSRKTAGLIPVEKSTGYRPYFKFDRDNVYFCKTERR